MKGSAYTPPPFSLTGWADPAYTPLPSTGVTVVTDVTDVTVAPELVGGSKWRATNIPRADRSVFARFPCFRELERRALWTNRRP